MQLSKNFSHNLNQPKGLLPTMLRPLTKLFLKPLVLASLCTLGTAMIPATAVSQETPLDAIIAVVNDDIILNSEFLRERNTMVSQNQPGLPSGEELDKLVVERLIIQSIQLQEAERRNIRIDESTLQSAIEDMARSNNVSTTELRNRINAEGLDFLQFREDLRKNLTVGALTRREIESRLFISDSEVEERLTSNAKKEAEFRYTLEHILINLPQQADTGQEQNALQAAQAIASQARDGETFTSLVREARLEGTDIEGGNLGSRSIEDMPDLFARQMNGLQEGDVTEPLRSAAGFHILKLVSRETVSQATPERVRARHVLVSTRGSSRSNIQAQERIREIQEQLASGVDFAQVAQTFSDDISTAPLGGDLGWFGTGEMVQEFEQAAFSTPVNTVSQPFKSAFGWHIVEVLEQELPEISEAETTEKVRDELRQQKGEERFQIWLTELRDNAYVELRGFAKDYQ